MLRSASESSGYFAAPHNYGLGDPYVCGDDFGLTTLEWVQARGSAVPACPPLSHAYMDLPDLISDDSGDDEDADSIACVLLEADRFSLQRAQELFLGGKSDIAAAQSMLADMESVDPACSPAPP